MDKIKLNETYTTTFDGEIVKYHFSNLFEIVVTDNWMQFVNNKNRKKRFLTLISKELFQNKSLIMQSYNTYGNKGLHIYLEPKGKYETFACTYVRFFDVEQDRYESAINLILGLSLTNKMNDDFYIHLGASVENVLSGISFDLDRNNTLYKANDMLQINLNKVKTINNTINGIWVLSGK